jgi:quercetin dioxygenase-like cupin family protein
VTGAIESASDARRVDPRDAEDVWVDLPGQRWEDFAHATDELVLVLEGTMAFEVEGWLVRPAVGEELLIPAGVRHSARNVGGTTARWLYGYRRG